MHDIRAHRQAGQDVKNSEEMSRVIVNASEATMLLIDTSGIILAINEAGALRLGKLVPELIGKNVLDLFPENLAQNRKQAMEQVCQAGKTVKIEDYRQGIWLESDVHPVFNENNVVTRLVIIAYDITRRKQAIEALQASEERYRGLAETAQDSIFIIDREDTVLYVNVHAAQWLGLPAGEIVGKKRDIFFPDGFGKRQKKAILRTIKSGMPRTHDAPSLFMGKTTWLSTRLVPLKDANGEFFAVLGVSRDISDRKRTEQALIRARRQLERRVARRTAELQAAQAQMRLLADQVISAQEEERRRVSRELHDDAGQMLISLRYKLAAMIENATGTECSVECGQLASALELVDATTEHLRTLAHSLRPPALEVGGIHISLKEFCRQFAEVTKIAVDYRGEDIPNLTQEISISLYRFVQEALTNVLKHARANRVRVRLKNQNNEIALTVSDNGRGFLENGTSGGIGLLGIEERLGLVGGSLKIRARTGKGVVLIARIPWEPENQD